MYVCLCASFLGVSVDLCVSGSVVSVYVSLCVCLWVLMCVCECPCVYMCSSVYEHLCVFVYPCLCVSSSELSVSLQGHICLCLCVGHVPFSTTCRISARERPRRRNRPSLHVSQLQAEILMKSPLSRRHREGVSLWSWGLVLPPYAGSCHRQEQAV